MQIITPCEVADQLKRGGEAFCCLPALGGEVRVLSINTKDRTIQVNCDVFSWCEVRGTFYTYNRIYPKKLNKKTKT